MGVYVVRPFVQLRELLASNTALARAASFTLGLIPKVRRLQLKSNGRNAPR